MAAVDLGATISLARSGWETTGVDVLGSAEEGTGTMRFCFGTINVRYRLPIEEILPPVAELGYEGVEVWGPQIDGKPDEELLALREEARELRLGIPCLTPYLCFTGTRQMWEASLAIAKRFVHYADLLGAPYIRGLTSVHIDLKNYRQEPVAELDNLAPSAEAAQEQWQQTIDAYRELSSHIEAAGVNVTFALETHGNNLSDTAAGCRRLLEAVGSPRLRILYQGFLGEEPVAGLEVIYDGVVHAHVQYVGGRGKEKFLPVVRKLAEKGYTGWVNVEFTDPPGEGEGLEVLWHNAARDLRLVREAARLT